MWMRQAQPKSDTNRVLSWRVLQPKFRGLLVGDSTASMVVMQYMHKKIRRRKSADKFCQHEFFLDA
jgi:hypothetical protein